MSKKTNIALLTALVVAASSVSSPASAAGCDGATGQALFQRGISKADANSQNANLMLKGYADHAPPAGNSGGGAGGLAGFSAGKCLSGALPSITGLFSIASVDKIIDALIDQACKAVQNEVSGMTNQVLKDSGLGALAGGGSISLPGITGPINVASGSIGVSGSGGGTVGVSGNVGGTTVGAKASASGVVVPAGVTQAPSSLVSRGYNAVTCFLSGGSGC